MQVSGLIGWLLFAVAVASIALVGLTWLEGAIVIWLPRTGESRFWNCFDKVLLTLRYISASEDKLARSRFLLPSPTERTSDEK